MGGFTARALAVNRKGDIAGWFLVFEPDIVRHAFLRSADGTVIDLGVLGGRFSDARDVNDDGVVVGESTIESLPRPASVNHASVWSGFRASAVASC
jgi:probable HAF family extracellular repeat protein